MDWKKIQIKNENEKKLLKRISAGSLIFDDQENFIYILGGKNEENKFLDDIIKFNLNSSHKIKISNYIYESIFQEKRKKFLRECFYW